MSTRLQLRNHLIVKDLPPDKLAQIRADFPAIAKSADEALGIKPEAEKESAKKGSKKTKRSVR